MPDAGAAIYTSADIVTFIEESATCDSEATFRGVRRELESKLGYQKRRMDEVKSDIDFLVQIVLRVGSISLLVLICLA